MMLNYRQYDYCALQNGNMMTISTMANRITHHPPLPPRPGDDPPCFEKPRRRLPVRPTSPKIFRVVGSQGCMVTHGGGIEKLAGGREFMWLGV